MCQNRVPVSVECYAGSRADELPRRVTIDEHEILITDIVESSIEESAASRNRVYRFKVKTEEGRILNLLKLSDGEWYLET